MSDFERLERAAKRYKEMYPPGTRLVCLSMEDMQAIAPGTRGTVVHVDDLGTIHMRWDNGRSLGLVPGEDSFRKLTDKELEEEKSSLDNKIQDADKRAKENNLNKDSIEKDGSVQEI